MLIHEANGTISLKFRSELASDEPHQTIQELQDSFLRKDVPVFEGYQGHHMYENDGYQVEELSADVRSDSADRRPSKLVKANTTPNTHLRKDLKQGPKQRGSYYFNATEGSIVTQKSYQTSSSRRHGQEMHDTAKTLKLS